jgi:phosphatidylglycerophosphate synthase
MVGLRAALGPAIAATARLAHPEAWLGAMIAAGFLSDVYDGILARRWKTDTDALRMADSVALVWGIVCDLEGLAMSMILQEWRRDVKTLRQALDLHREMCREMQA